MNKKLNSIVIGLLVGLTFTACSNNNEDVVNTPNRDGSIETVLSTEHKTGYDLLTTQHKVWVKGQLDTVLTKVDTLKNLGYTIEQGSSQNENNDGRNVMVPKDYEIYITVK